VLFPALVLVLALRLLLQPHVRSRCSARNPDRRQPGHHPHHGARAGRGVSEFALVRAIERTLSWFVWIAMVLWITDLSLVLDELEAIHWLAAPTSRCAA
jgi:hypothetical protein